MMEYEIVSDDTLYGLVVEMNKYLSDGWRPFGNLVVITTHADTGRAYQSHGFRYIQAIIKDHEPEAAQ